MTARATTEEVELIEVGGGDRGPASAEFRPGRGGDGGATPLFPQRIYISGIVLALAAMLMFFMALASAYVVRKGLSGDWIPLGLPRILWLNTSVIIVSSLTIERARRLLAPPSAGLAPQAAGLRDFRGWWGLTTALGVAFLVGQLFAWRQLAAAGIYLATNPSSSFFYLITTAHGIHLLGGLVALSVVGFRSWPAEARVNHGTAVTVSAIYWHFLGALWVFLFLLLLV
ncbi:MAG: heme-copper oxidase subunit III, partial [Candidatus Acidiferrales bacterium]